MPDSYYYWFDTTDKGVQSPKVRPINKKNVEEVIEEYIIHVKDDEELDKVPKLIKNVEKYTTTWGGKWDKEKQERFQGWVKDSYDSIMKKELRSLADDHLQDWGDFYDGLHLSEDTTTVEDLQSLADIREFAGYQFAPPESDLGESQRELSLQRKTMKWKEFLDERSISDLGFLTSSCLTSEINISCQISSSSIFSIAKMLSNPRSILLFRFLVSFSLSPFAGKDFPPTDSD